jgi:hypothetical protein
MSIALTPWFHLPRSAARRRAWAGPEAAPPQVLQSGATMVVPQPQGATIECRRGCLWLTHDGDCKDIVLSAGERYVSGSRRRLPVHALDDAQVLVTR